MTQPETCGAAGGTISLWVKISNCRNYDGIISTRGYNEYGQVIYCLEHGSTIRYTNFYI